MKEGETKQLDVYCDSWWFTATVHRINARYIHIRFNNWDKQWDKWIYLEQITDFIIFGKEYICCKPSPPPNPEQKEQKEDIVLPKPQRLWNTKIKFAPLNQHTIKYEKMELCPFIMHTKPMYYYSKLQQKAFIIAISHDAIHKYDILNDEWNTMIEYPQYFGTQYKTCIDQEYGKLYFICPVYINISTYNYHIVFGVFDLETSKWNLIQLLPFGAHRIRPESFIRSFEAFYCVHKNDKYDKKELETKEFEQDGIQFYDEKQNKWKSGLVWQEFDDSIKIRYIEDGMTVYDTFSDIEYKREPIDYECDQDLVKILRNIKLCILGQRVDARYTGNMIYEWKDQESMLQSTESNVICERTKNSKYLYIPKTKTVMLLGGQKFRRYGYNYWGSRNDVTKQIYYKSLLTNKAWNEYKTGLPARRENHKGFGEKTDIILVHDRIVVMFCFDFGEIFVGI